jgi:hypothetical protein
MSRTASELAHLFRPLKAPAAARALPVLADGAREEQWSYERFAEALLSTMAVATTSSPKISPHALNGRRLSPAIARRRHRRRRTAQRTSDLTRRLTSQHALDHLALRARSEPAPTVCHVSGPPGGR